MKGILADASVFSSPAMESQTPCAAAGSQPVSVPVAEDVSTPDAAIMKSSDCFQRNAVAASAVMDERADNGKKMETPDTRIQDEPCAPLANAPPLGDVATPVAATSSEPGSPPGQPLPALQGVSAAVLTEEKNTAKAAYTGLNELSCDKNSPTLTSEVFELNYLLSYLNLNDCPLTSLPKEIGKLRILRSLKVRSCKWLACLPDTIGGMEMLTELHLSGCSSLTSLPDSIEQLKNLKKIDLSLCNMTTLPDSIGGCHSLRIFVAEYSDLRVLPNTVCDLVLLENIQMRSSRLTALPDEFGRLKRLEILELCSSGIRRLPNSIGGCDALLRLGLYNCKMLTELPNSVGELQRLQFLNVNQCSSLSKLPSSIVGLDMLSEICTMDRLRYRIPGYIHDPNGTVVLHTNQQQNMLLRSYLPGLRLMLTLVLAMRRKKMKRALPELFEWLWREFVEPL